MNNSTLQEVKQKLENILKRLSLYHDNTNDGIHFFKLESFESIIEEIDSFTYFNYLTKPLKEAFRFFEKSEITLPAAKANKVFDDFEKLIIAINSALKPLIDNLHVQNPNSVNIKFPPVENLGDLSKYSRELHLAISQIIINDDVKGEEKIESVENGSIWINIMLGTPTATMLIGSVVWAAMVIRKKKVEGDFAVEQVKAMKIKNESMKDILSAHKEYTKILIDAEAKYIQSEYFKKNNPEDLERIKMSIETFSDLINKGAEIQPSLMSPESVSNLFPTIPELVESKAVKKIGKE